jgi:hypothetical protein
MKVCVVVHDDVDEIEQVEVFDRKGRRSISGVIEDKYRSDVLDEACCERTRRESRPASIVGDCTALKSSLLRSSSDSDSKCRLTLSSLASCPGWLSRIQTTKG